MSKKSAGILLYRFSSGEIEFFLAHPGGPIWANKDEGSWTIPKGEFTDEELPLSAAQREFEEETGIRPEGNFVELSPVRQKSGKLVLAWALESDADASSVKSNLFEMEWPPRSGRKQKFPEIDKAAWFKLDEALTKIRPEQKALLLECIKLLDESQ